MANRRVAPRAYHCAWCNKIRVGRFWVPERRRLRPGGYADVVCQRCRFFYFRGFDVDGFLSWYRVQARATAPQDEE
jgi:hypothetical protein